MRGRPPSLRGDAAREWIALALLCAYLVAAWRCSKKPTTPPRGQAVPGAYSYTPPPAPKAPTPRPGRPTRTPTIA